MVSTDSLNCCVSNTCDSGTLECLLLRCRVGLVSLIRLSSRFTTVLESVFQLELDKCELVLVLFCQVLIEVLFRHHLENQERAQLNPVCDRDQTAAIAAPVPLLDFGWKADLFIAGRLLEHTNLEEQPEEL